MEKYSAEDLYEDLLDRIIRIDLEPGKRISENEICSQYNVSRSVVRSAFIRLSQYNLLTVYPQRGTYVNLIDLDYVRKALLIRISLEKELLGRFLDSENKEETIERLQDNLARQANYYSEEDYTKEFKDLDEEFHNIILSSMGDEGVLDLLDGHLLHISRWRNVYVKLGYRISRLVDEHGEILNAIKRDDKEHAMSAMQVHIDTINDLITVDSEYAEYFKQGNYNRNSKKKS